jgi:hypothetical protein
MFGIGRGTLILAFAAIGLAHQGREAHAVENSATDSVSVNSGDRDRNLKETKALTLSELLQVTDSEAQELLITGLVQHKINEEQERESLADFKGFNLGAALALAVYLDEPVEEAAMAGGVVRVTRQRDAVTRLMLESHYFFVPKEGRIGLGPFVGVLSSGEKIVDALGFGFMLGLRSGVRESRSFNVGLGLMVEPDLKHLGSGLVDGAELPDGETEIRYQEASAEALLLLVSFTF